MAVIDITSELYSDVTYTRTISARQLLEIPAAELVALRVVDREEPEFKIWVRIDEIERCTADNRLTLVCVSYDDGYEVTQYYLPNQKIEVALVG